MGISARTEGTVAIVRAERRLVVANRQDLKATVVKELEAGKTAVVIDFRDTDLIDSGGLGVLVTLYRYAQDQGATLVLADLSRELSELLRLTKLDTIFQIAGNVDDAVRACAREAPMGEHSG